jgi:hypothetical protein
MNSTRKQAPQFRVGDWVTLPYGPQRVLAQVIEDRGALGVNRRRLYRVRLGPDREEADTFEIREEFLQPAARPGHNAQPPGVS